MSTTDSTHTISIAAFTPIWKLADSFDSVAVRVPRARRTSQMMSGGTKPRMPAKCEIVAHWPSSRSESAVVSVMPDIKARGRRTERSDALVATMRLLDEADREGVAVALARV